MKASKTSVLLAVLFVIFVTAFVVSIYEDNQFGYQQSLSYARYLSVWQPMIFFHDDNHSSVLNYKLEIVYNMYSLTGGVIGNQCDVRVVVVRFWTWLCFSMAILCGSMLCVAIKR